MSVTHRNGVSRSYAKLKHPHRRKGILFLLKQSLHVLFQPRPSLYLTLPGADPWVTELSMWIILTLTFSKCQMPPGLLLHLNSALSWGAHWLAHLEPCLLGFLPLQFHTNSSHLRLHQEGVSLWNLCCLHYSVAILSSFPFSPHFPQRWLETPTPVWNSCLTAIHPSLYTHLELFPVSVQKLKQFLYLCPWL